MWVSQHSFYQKFYLVIMANLFCPSSSFKDQMFLANVLVMS